MNHRAAIRTLAVVSGIACSMVAASIAWATPAVPAAGSITEFAIPTPSSSPEAITPGPDGNLWFTETNANQIARITTSGAITEFPNTAPGKVGFGITPGPNGYLWYTECSYSYIGRITTAGVVKRAFQVPLPSCPFLITAGPDGNLWWTDTNYSKIGRITPSGTVTQFPTPTPNQFPWDITTGPDGNLWFTESNHNNGAIGRITTSGMITEFPIPTPSGSPRGITVGPDGNLWFTEPAAAKIGRITTSGMITEFDVSNNPEAVPINGITAAADGGLWYPAILGPGTPPATGVADITPTGMVTYPFASPLENAAYIGPGADTNLWVTQGNTNEIGRITDAAIPAIALSPRSGPPGTQVTVSGSGFGSLEKVKLTFIDSVNGKTMLGTVATDTGGHFSTSVMIPANATLGAQKIKAIGVSSGLTKSKIFKVT